MADEKVGIEVTVKKQISALGETRAELDKVSAEVARMRREFKSGSGDATALGAAMQKQAQLARDLQSQTKNLSGVYQKLGLDVKSLTSTVAAQSGAVGPAVEALAGLGTAAGIAAGGVVAVAAALVVGAHGIASYQEQMEIAAEATGLTTGQLAGLKVAAAESGRSFEQVRPALDYFTRKIGEAATGNKEAAKTFDDLRVGVHDAGGAIRPTGDVLRDIQQKLNAIHDPAIRSKAAVELFGRSGAAAINVLLTPIDEAEAKARKLGVALGPEAERVAHMADTAFDALGTSITGIGNAFGVTAASITNQFLPALAEAASQVAEFINMKKSNDWMGNLFRGAAFVASGGSPNTIAGAAAGVVPGGPKLRPDQWEIPEGNRPWNTAGVMKNQVDEATAKLREQIKTIEEAVAQGRMLADEGISQLQTLIKQEASVERQNMLWAEQSKLINEQNELLMKRGGPGIGIGPIQENISPPIGNAQRPIVHNPDGSFSTERTITAGFDGRFFNIPTIVGGVQKSAQEAIKLYLKGLNDAVGEFATEEAALEAARARTILIGKSRESEAFQLHAVHDINFTLIPQPAIMVQRGTATGPNQRTPWDEFLRNAKNAERGIANLSDRLNEAKAATDDAAAAQQDFAQSVEEGLKSQLVGAFQNFVNDAILHVQDLDQAFQALGQSILETLVQAGVKAGLGALFPGIAKYLFQQGGTPIRAQSGLIVTGTRGIDNVPALLGRGETVISHAETDDLRAFKSEMRAFVRALTPVAGQTQVSQGSGGVANVTFTFEDSGFFSVDKIKRQQILRDEIAPELRRVLAKGTR